MAKIENGQISTSEAAIALGITRQRVLQLIEKGKLKAKKFATVYIINKSDLEAIKDRAPGRPSKNSSCNKKAVNKVSFE